MPRSTRTLSVLAALTAGLLVPAGGQTKTLVIPHLIEQIGTIENTSFTFDTQIYLTYLGNMDGGPGSGQAAVDLYIYDPAGGFLMGNTDPVCDPCTFVLDTGNRKTRVRVDDLFTSAGGFQDPVEVGYAVLTVTGDAENLALSCEIVNAHTGPLDLSVFVFEPEPVATGTASTTRVFPHFLEQSGSIVGNQFTVDTAYYLAYVAGLPGVGGPAPGATVDIFLFDDQTGQLMTGGAGGVVCGPCSFSLGQNQRLFQVPIEGLLQGAGGFGSEPRREGCAVVTVSGDADHVSLQQIGINAHTGPQDVDISGSFAIPVAEVPGSALNVPQDRPGLASRVVAAPNPFRASTAVAFDLERAGRVTVAVYDLQGRRVAVLADGHHEAGRHSLEWDGTDDRGRTVPAGVFYAQVQGPDGSRVSRMVRVR